MPAHHDLEAYLDACLEAAGPKDQKNPPLPINPRPHGRTHGARPEPDRRLPHDPAPRERCGPDVAACCHTFQATGITACTSNGGLLANAQLMAAHESPPRPSS